MHDDRFYPHVVAVERPSVVTDEGGEQTYEHTVVYAAMPGIMSHVTGKEVSVQTLGIDALRGYTLRFPASYSIRATKRGQLPDIIVWQGRRFAVRGVWINDSHGRAVLEETA